MELEGLPWRCNPYLRPCHRQNLLLRSLLPRCRSPHHLLPFVCERTGQRWLQMGQCDCKEPDTHFLLAWASSGSSALRFVTDDDIFTNEREWMRLWYRPSLMLPLARSRPQAFESLESCKCNLEFILLFTDSQSLVPSWTAS